MKKSLLFILMTLLTTSAMWAQDYDDYDDEEFGDYFSATIEGVEWEFVIIDEEEKNCAICYVYDELSGEVTLPSEVQYGNVTYTVTAIGEGAFYNCESLTSVSIGDGVVTIGTWAFAGCGLTSVTIPNSVTNLGEATFNGCESLTSVSIGDGVVTIGAGAFAGCGLTSVTIPNSVINLGEGAFSGCESLTSVSIGNGVTAIEEYVFGGCSSLASINIGSGVTTIDESAFSGCNAITSIVIDTDNPKYDSRNNCNAIIETATNTLVQGFASTVIPDGVTTIGEFAFEGCTDLATVTIPDGVTTIGEFAFSGCTDLATVTIPNSVTTIGDAAFLNCNGLTSFTIPNSVTTIGNGAFQGCNGLTSITIPNSVATIGYSPFYGCDNLKTVSLNCPTVGSWFANDNNIEEIIIGSEVKTIESGAFYGCRKITTFTIPATVTSIGSEAFVGMESISVEDGNPVYDSRDNCNAVIETATNTLIIGSNSTKVPSSVTAFGDYAFVKCDNLKSIYIPASMTSIGRGAFGYCPDIESIIVDEDNTVYDSRQGCNAIIETATNTLVIGCKNTDIPASIKTIGNTAFYGADVVSVNIPDGVVVIGDGSFFQCDKLESVTIPSSVTTIGRQAFYGCDSLLSVEIPSSVSSLGNAAFAFCTSLIRAELPSNLDEIPDDLLAYCESLASVAIPSTVKSIGSYAFEGCSSLRTISIPASVSSIGEWAFAGCDDLEKIYSYIEEPFEWQNYEFSCLLYVPAGTKEKYQNTEGWKYFEDIIEMKEEEHQQPQPVITNFVVDREMYLYNIGANAFFTEGNSWGTQASVGSQGLLVRFKDTGNGAYLLEDYSLSKNGWYKTFFDTETALFVDQSWQENYYWEVEDNGDGTFRLLASSHNPTFNKDSYPGMYVGLDTSSDADNTALSPFLSPGKEHHIDWALVSEVEYENLANRMALYDKAQKLKEIIALAKSVGADVSGPEAVYLNKETTMEELDSAIKDAQMAYIAAIIDNAEEKDNVDVTLLLTNPDFEQDETGWTVTAASGDGYNGYQGNVRPGGSSTNHCYEAWNNSSFDIYQEVSGAPVGVYEIQVQGFYRYWRGNNAWNAYLEQSADYVKPKGVPVYVYLNNNATNFVNVFGDPRQITDETFYSNSSTDYASQVATDGTRYYFPNGMASAAIAFSDGMYKQSAYGLIANEGDVMRIGVKGNSSQMNDSWVIWDDFKLIYRGFNPDVIKPVLETAMEDVRGYLGLLMGKTEYTALSAAFTAAETAIEDNDGEAMFNALNALYDAKDPARISKDIFLEADIAADTLRLAEAIRGVDTQKVPQQTLDEATALLAGICNNQLYENDETDELKDDVTAMINSLRTSRLLMAVVKAEMITDLGKTEDSYAYLQNVIAEIRSLNIGQLNEYYVDYYSNRLQNAIDNLQLRPGYAYLTADMFRLWDKCDAADATDLDNSYCLFNLRTSTDMVYGTSQVDQFRYADLSGFDKLYIPVAAGTPRILMNRTEDQGQFSENKEQSKMLEMPKDGTWAEAYYSQSDDGKLFTYDIAKIVEENGYAHLNAIKDAYWQKVTVPELILYNSKLLVAEIDYSDYSNYPYYRADAPEGTSYDVVDGRLMINNTLDSLNAWDLQSFIIDGFNIERGHDYIVRITYKSTTSGKANVQFGTWSLDMTKYDVGIDATESFTTVDVLSPMVTCPTDNQDAHVIWHGGSIVGTVEISKVQVYEVLSEDPLFDAKVELRDAVAKAKMRTSFGKTEASFASLGTAIVNAETVLETAKSTNEIENALYSLNSAVNNLKLLPGYTYLQDFYWSSNYNLCTPTSLAWGDGDVNFSDYADLSNYDYLYIPVAEGTPRVLMNRTEYDGQFNEDKELSKMLEMPKDGTWAEAYYTVSDNGKMFAFNIAKIVEDYGFARLHAIKDANWGKVTVTDLILYTDQTVAEDEWNQLAAVYESMENTSEWNKNWDFTDESHSISSLPGVEMIHRHIVSIDLSSNNLSGNFPIGMLSLPYLEKLYLSDNQLTGNVGQLMDTYVEQNPTATFSLKKLYINNNQLSGNIGAFSYPLTNLTYLDATYNKLDDVDPVISPSVSAYLYGQTIDRTIDIDLPNLKVNELLAQIPKLFLYDHHNQSFLTDFSMRLWYPVGTMYTSDGLESAMTYSVKGGILQLPEHYDGGQVYRGQSGDTLDIGIGNNNGFLKARLYFDQGDANLDGPTNVLDLQTIINYMFEEYTSKMFNFTAANLWSDEVINVQDAVCLVNLLLDKEVSPAPTDNQSRRTEAIPSAEPNAYVFIEDGKLSINSVVPVSAFDIVLSTSQMCEALPELSKMGFTCSIKRIGSQVHLVGYSFSGATLPTGKTDICNLSDGAIDYIMLADSKAQEISSATNSTATKVHSSFNDTELDKEVFRIPLGSKHSISIDASGKKTIIKNKK